MRRRIPQALSFSLQQNLLYEDSHTADNSTVNFAHAFACTYAIQKLNEAKELIHENNEHRMQLNEITKQRCHVLIVDALSSIRLLRLNTVPVYEYRNHYYLEEQIAALLAQIYQQALINLEELNTTYAILQMTHHPTTLDEVILRFELKQYQESLERWFLAREILCSSSYPKTFLKIHVDIGKHVITKDLKELQTSYELRLEWFKVK